MRRTTWRDVAVAVVLGIGILVVMIWYDSSVMVRAQQEGSASFDMSKYSIFWIVGSVGLAASVLVIGAIGFRVRSAIVGVVYALLGGLLLATPLVIIGNPATYPSWVNDTLGRLFVATNGPLSAGTVLGGAMLIGGIVSIWRAFATRSATATA